MNHVEKAVEYYNNIFKTFCPKMVESAAEIVNEMIIEGIC